MRGSRNHVDSCTKQFAEYADADGQVILDPAAAAAGLPVADHRPDQARARFAYLGFTGVWYGNRYDAEYNADRRSSPSPTGPSTGPSRR